MSLQTNILFLILLQLVVLTTDAQSVKSVKEVSVDSGWANNSVNTVVFRKNSLCTYKNTQYISFYNQEGFVVIGKRKLGSKNWKLETTQFKGKVTDAHNSISIMVDGDGYLHLAWDHHNNRLHYAKSVSPGSLQLTDELSMTGLLEKNVTYPEFYLLPNNNLLFFYRDGQSGQGNLVINRYDLNTKKWTQLHTNLIDGQKQRNAYWQACVDKNGTIHLSWVWRESSDLSSNHDLCYAKSMDGGITWMNSKNELYVLPINATTAEYIVRIPQKSELINQTSMSTDDKGNPFIASYWNEKGSSVPQYQIAYNIAGVWKVSNTGFRTTAFSLSGVGTKRVPISRPQIVLLDKGKKRTVVLLYRDEERGSKVSAAICNDLLLNKWELTDLSNTSVGSWEPSFDTNLWIQKKRLHLFVQYTNQQDGEGNSNIRPQPVQVVEVKIIKK